MKLMFVNKKDVYVTPDGSYIAIYEKLMKENNGEKDCIPCGCYLRISYKKVRLELIFLGIALKRCRLINKYFKTQNP